jgi:hypothetical protein
MQYGDSEEVIQNFRVLHAERERRSQLTTKKREEEDENKSV